MPYANDLLNYLFYSRRKHDVTLFFNRIARLPIAHVTQLNCYDTPLQISQRQTCGHRTHQTYIRWIM